MNYYAIFITIAVIVAIVIIGILLFKRKLPNPTPFKSVWSTKDKECIMRTLRNGMRILKSNNITMIPVFGTLIGVLRHKGIIPWDDDIDFAIRRDQKELLFSLKKELADANIGLLSTTGKADWAKIFPLDRPLIEGRPWSWPYIDIFYYDEEGKDITLSYGSKISKNDFLPLKKGVFEGISVHIPNNPNKILEDEYGRDWKDICISSHYNHRLERKQKGGHRARCVDVM